MNDTTRELDKLFAAVDKFASEMKVKLEEHALNGKRGWDGDNPSDQELAGDLWYDAGDLFDGVCVEPVQYSDQENKLVIDIANRAMMLWYRHNVKEDGK